MASLSDVFTADEIARAAGVPREAVLALVESGALQAKAGTEFFTGPDAVRAGREAREVARGLADARTPDDLFSISVKRPVFVGRERGGPTLAVSVAHAMLVLLMIWLAHPPEAAMRGSAGRQHRSLPS